MPLTASSPGFQKKAEKINNHAEREREREREYTPLKKKRSKKKHTHTHQPATPLTNFCEAGARDAKLTAAILPEARA
jgi:hypothetical protein